MIPSIICFWDPLTYILFGVSEAAVHPSMHLGRDRVQAAQDVSLSQGWEDVFFKWSETPHKWLQLIENMTRNINMRNQSKVKTINWNTSFIKTKKNKPESILKIMWGTGSETERGNERHTANTGESEWEMEGKCMQEMRGKSWRREMRREWCGAMMNSRYSISVPFVCTDCTVKSPTVLC